MRSNTTGASRSSLARLPATLAGTPLFLLSLYAAGRLDRSVAQAAVLTLGIWAAVRVTSWSCRWSILLLTAVLPCLVLISWLRRDLTAQRGALQAAFSRAQALASKGGLPDAAAIYEGLLRQAPESAELHFSLGKARLLQGRRDEARLHLREALRLAPEGHPLKDQARALLLLAGKRP